MNDMTVLDQALVPASNALLLTELAREHGLDADALLAQVGIHSTSQCQEGQWLTVRQCSGLMGLVRQETGLSALGYELGLRTPGTAHGLYGLGLLSSATPQEALALATRFSKVRNPSFDMSWAVEGGWAVVTLVDLMPQAPWRQLATEWVLLSMVRTGEAMLGAAGEGARAACELSLPWPQPAYHAAYALRLPPCRFDAADAALRFPSSWLTQRLGGAAAASVQLAHQACERDLAWMAAKDSVAQGVKALLGEGLACGGYPSRETVACRLHVSVSTLKRQLQQEGSSFSALLDEVRLRDARRLLSHPGMTVEAVAAQLGYHNTANFTRAFRQWSGTTPSAWRQGQA